MTRASLVLVLVLVLVLAPGCHPARVNDPPASASIGAPKAPSLAVDPSATNPSEVVAPFELEMAGTGFCARIGDRVHCAAPRDERDWVRLSSFAVVSGVEDAISISATSPIFGCAVTRRGAVSCWGNNTNGQLGAGLTEWFYDKPVVVPGIRTARRVAASERHACALLRDGTVRCWGDNSRGQTAGETAYGEEARELSEPEPVAGVTDAVALAASESATCAVTKSGRTLCWGAALFEDEGQRRSVGPTVVASLEGLENIRASSGNFCGVRRGEVLCWGYSLFHDQHGEVHAPRAVRLPGPARTVRIGSAHACALLTDGRVACWGSNWSCAMGDSDIHISSSSTELASVVQHLPPAIDVFAGSGATCALTRPQGLFCWGMWPTATGEVYLSAPVAIQIE